MISLSIIDSRLMLDFTPALVERIQRTVDNAECIDRAIMPQVDEQDVAELLKFLASRGISTYEDVISPRRLKGYQRINKAKVRGMAKSLLKGASMRPTLISRDEIIVDGNHRSAAHRVIARPQHVIVIGGNFADVFGHVCEFPKTYEV